VSDHDVSGQAHALTLMIPVDPAKVSDLATLLDTLPGGDESPLARVPGTQFARWVVLDQLVYQGPPQKRDPWDVPRLMFTSNFDGPLERYVEGLRTGLGKDADRIFGHCQGYPGSGGAQAWAAWVMSCRIPSALFFAAYGDQTVQQVRTNLDQRTKLIAFALEAQGLPPEQLKARFMEVFGT
jgi:hypothetical protein